jgi:hypothetical protein
MEHDSVDRVKFECVPFVLTIMNNGRLFYLPSDIRS